MSRRSLTNSAVTAIGIVLLAWQVRDVGGLATVRDGLGRVGAGFGLIMALAFVRFALRTCAWVALFERKVPLRAAIAATISGDALGNITPLGLAASEPAKAVYLRPHMDATQALAALFAENFFYSVSVALYVIAGAIAMIAAFDLPARLQQAGIAVLGLMGAVLVGACWIAWQRPAAASAIVSRLPSARLRRVVDRVRDFEARTYGSPGHKGARLGLLAASELGFHLVSFLEAWLILSLLTGESQPLQAFVLDSVNRVINVVFKVVPLRVGVDEVSSEQVAAAIGLARGVGTQAALVRKVRMTAWAAVGLVLWATRAGATTRTIDRPRV
ncbi:MAG: flippase-like domain-containing protein [Acidobacteria bacterium]|nr:flippase-like domain-containing protein [Acidobacteriota bacterium]